MPWEGGLAASRSRLKLAVHSYNGGADHPLVGVPSHRYKWRVTVRHRSRRLTPMRWLIFFLLVLVLIGGGMKLAGMQLPIFDYPLGGPMTQPQIEIQQPDMNLP